MAYIKQFTNGAGFTGEYWKVTGLVVNKLSNFLEITVSCYKDKASRLDDKSPFAVKMFSIKLDAIDATKDIFEQVYKLLPTLKSTTEHVLSSSTPFFEGAKQD